MKKSTIVNQSPFNSIKLLLALGLFLGLCFLMVLTRSTYSELTQSFFLFIYAVVWALVCVRQIRYKKVKQNGPIQK